jgi:hypothetical protein
MRRVVRFGSYTLPLTVPERSELLRTSFGDGVPRTVRLPGASGGFDMLGADPLPSEIGTVRARFSLIADSAAAMRAARDAVMGMAGMGREHLVLEMHDGSQRWAWAKVNAIQMPAEHDSISARIAEVTVDWQVAYPRWFSAASGSPLVIAASGALTDAALTTSGTAVAQPIITLTATSAIGATGVRIRRMVGSITADELVYAAALANGDVLTFDCRALTVRRNGVDAYINGFSAQHPAWLRLHPGANIIRVVLGAGETAAVSVAWDDTWY